jgi:hypothetical protein
MGMGAGAGRFEQSAKARWHAGTLANWHAGKLITRGDTKPIRDIRLDWPIINLRLDIRLAVVRIKAMAVMVVTN